MAVLSYIFESSNLSDLPNVLVLVIVSVISNKSVDLGSSLTTGLNLWVFEKELVFP